MQHTNFEGDRISSPGPLYIRTCTCYICIENIAGILRNLGHKKRERTRQESTLLYTPGALTWKVSVIFRSGKVSFHNFIFYQNTCTFVCFTVASPFL